MCCDDNVGREVANEYLSIYYTWSNPMTVIVFLAFLAEVLAM
jgi:hypothetical protein